MLPGAFVDRSDFHSNQPNSDHLRSVCDRKSHLSNGWSGRACHVDLTCWRVTSCDRTTARASRARYARPRRLAKCDMPSSSSKTGGARDPDSVAPITLQSPAGRLGVCINAVISLPMLAVIQSSNPVAERCRRGADGPDPVHRYSPQAPKHAPGADVGLRLALASLPDSLRTDHLA